MEIRAAEISEIIKKQIASFGTEAEVAEVGTVLSVGDGIARVYGLANAVALAERDYEELRATGARPRKIVRTGVDALTPSEARVARLAAGGMTLTAVTGWLFYWLAVVA